MRKFIKQKFSEIDSTTSAATLWQHYNGIMQDAINQFVPTSTVKRKHMLWKKWKHSNNDSRYNVITVVIKWL